MSVAAYLGYAALVLAVAALYFGGLVRREYRARGRLRFWIGAGQLLPMGLWAAFGGRSFRGDGRRPTRRPP